MYTINHLKSFVVLAEELHFGRAAERLHTTRPPLSQKLRQLEEFLGVELLKRTTRSVGLTDAGKVFLEGARGVLERIENINLQARLALAGNAGRLSIGFVPSAAYVFLPKVLRRYKALYPHVNIHLEEMPYLRIQEQLRNGAIDVALLRTSTRERAVMNHVAMREALIAAIPRRHRLAKAKAISLKDLHEERFIAFSGHDSPYFSERISELMSNHRVEPNIVQYSLLPTILSFVEAGIGVAIVPDSVRRIANPNVVYKRFIDLQAKDGVELTAAWHRNHSSILVAKFVEILQALNPA